jgi:hypothetical protein
MNKGFDSKLEYEFGSATKLSSRQNMLILQKNPLVAGFKSKHKIAQREL